MDTVCAGMSVGTSGGTTIIRVGANVSDKEFKAVIEQLGLTGTTDYEVGYDPVTGDEIWLVPSG